jgi:hypothetical protein
MGLCLRNLSADSTAPLPSIGSWLAVDEITISAFGKYSGISDNKIASAEKSVANF